MEQQAPPMRDPGITVLVADDHEAMRAALSELITAEPSTQLVGLAADAEEAVALCELHRPDVALLDVRMPGGGQSAARQIRMLCPGTRVVALSAYGDRSAVLGMVGSGVVGYLVKSASGQEIIATIQRAARGGVGFSEEVTEHVITELTDQLRRQERKARQLEQRLKRIEAILDTPSDLRVVFQPIVDLRSGQTVGAEALSRFPDEHERGPDAWFSEAATVGRGTKLEALAIRRALELLPQLPRDIFLAVNVSPEAIMAPEFAVELIDAPIDRLVVEITEHAPVGDYDGLQAILARPRAQGLRLAIDDAGAGYSSLQHILRLAPDIIKLDASLTRNVHDDGFRRALARALIPFADEIGAHVIAEGIETADEQDALRALGAAYGQGFHLARPAPPPLAMSTSASATAEGTWA